MTLALQCRTRNDDLLAYAFCDYARRDRMGDRMIPLRLDLIDRHAHAGAVDRAVRGNRSDHDGDRILAAAAIGDVGKQERPALGLVEPADELPAHQRVQFGILVDRLVDGQQQTALFERLEVFVQIGITALAVAHRNFAPGNL